MAPVGREFGSQDYERLMQEDSLALKSALAELIARSQAAVAAKSQPVDPSELSDALNVQTALREWGCNVDVMVAASVWRSYSHSLRAHGCVEQRRCLRQSWHCFTTAHDISRKRPLEFYGHQMAIIDQSVST